MRAYPIQTLCGLVSYYQFSNKLRGTAHQHSISEHHGRVVVLRQTNAKCLFPRYVGFSPIVPVFPAGALQAVKEIRQAISSMFARVATANLLPVDFSQNLQVTLRDLILSFPWLLHSNTGRSRRSVSHARQKVRFYGRSDVRHLRRLLCRLGAGRVNEVLSRGFMTRRKTHERDNRQAIHGGIAGTTQTGRDAVTSPPRAPLSLRATP